MEERLQKALARAGVASRRECEQLIAAGRVRVNGLVVRELGSRVNLDEDAVLVDGKPVRPPPPRLYLMMHKPVGVVSTVRDPQGRPTVLDLVKIAERVFPVGRLDLDSEGLLLLTNDGELTHRLTHPNFQVEKEYHALLHPAPSQDALRRWRQGVVLHGCCTAPAQVEVMHQSSAGTWVRIVLHEGRKRQIREVARALGMETRRLIRVREGRLVLGKLSAGKWRMLEPDEVEALER